MTFQVLNLSDVFENPNVTQAVDIKSEEFKGLVKSIRKLGVLRPITVRKVKKRFQIIDGSYRYHASLVAKKTTIPANVMTFTAQQALEVSMMGSVHRVVTTPLEYKRALLRIITMNPNMTIVELGAKLERSKGWVVKKLGLGKLKTAFKGLLYDGHICLVNAHSLSKLPKAIQSEMIGLAMFALPEDFNNAINKRMK